MTRTDTFVVGTLVVLLAIVAGLIGVPALQPRTAPSTAPGLTEPPADVRPYVEGVLSMPTSVSPLTARTQADRDLVALIFAGLVRNGPNGTIVADLADAWSVDAKGKVWTVELRDDVTWHDGTPVTSDDVVYTFHALQDPEYTGPAAGSWSEVAVRALSPTTVTFTLDTPLGGFLQALTQPLAPAHLLADVPVTELADDPFGQAPVGAGPFALVELTDTSASLIPAPADGSVPEDPTTGTPGSTDPLVTPGPTARPARPIPYLEGIEFKYYTDPEELAADYRSGTLDAVSGLPPRDAAQLGSRDGSRLLRYPGSTLTTVLLNVRPDRPEFRDPAVRTALLAAIDRATIVDQAFASLASSASGPIPPSSSMFDPTADPPVAFDRTAARKALKTAGWTEKDDLWHLPGSAAALTIEVLSPTADVNPGLHAAAAAVVHDWRAIGLDARHEALPPGEFVTDRLSVGAFQVAVVDMAIGLDPDLYPLLASTQTLTGGSNVIGVQDPTLDALLTKARAPGTDEERRAAYSALQKQLAAGRYLLPLAFADEVTVARDTLEGPVIRLIPDVSDRFWDVLTWRLAADR